MKLLRRAEEALDSAEGRLWQRSQRAFAVRALMSARARSGPMPGSTAGRARRRWRWLRWIRTRSATPSQLSMLIPGIAASRPTGDVTIGRRPVRDRCSMLHAPLLLTGEDVQPERGVLRRRRTEESDPVVEDLEQGSAERLEQGRGRRPDHHPPRAGRHDADLVGAQRPDSRVSDRRGSCAGRRRSCARPRGRPRRSRRPRASRSRVDLRASRDEQRRNVRPPLAHVNGYRHLIHEQTLSKRKRAPCVPTQHPSLCLIATPSERTHLTRLAPCRREASARR